MSQLHRAHTSSWTVPLQSRIYFLPCCLWGFPGHAIGREPAHQFKRCRFNPWVGKIPWRRNWQPTPIFLPGKSHGQRSLVGYSLWGRKELDTTEYACAHTHTRRDVAFVSAKQMLCQILVSSHIYPFPKLSFP